ncbi:unnamed protein product [Fraxinus pennsylvanica]|uniref:DDE Tnp4 domain-containing protein n=1 Tax=Fraxinus pennsylvanica TaxID=56036 RepID=A0AAD1Z9Z7_9LAMI|nr:unnamed protein product [Fraxinus pennsylvanica]
MEISSSPFQEDFSFFNFIQDFEPSSIPLSNTKKRHRNDGIFDFNDESNESSEQEFVSNFLVFDDQQEDKPAQKAKESIPTETVHSMQPNSFLDFEFKQIDQEMNEGGFFSDYFQKNDIFKDFEFDQSSPAKRARVETNDDAAASDDSTTIVGGGAQRRLWVKNRSNAWWEQVNSPDFPEEEFKRTFRMSKATFDMICEELESVVTKKDTMLRLAIPVRKRVAVCIWRLATGEALREVSKRFGLGISTCHKLVFEVCSAIKSVLMPKFLQWPDENKMKETKEKFEFKSGIPNVGGSIYTTHVPIIAPKNNLSAYFNKRHTERNQKTSYSITVQGVVDSKGVFTDICIGWPGSMTDDQVLEKSALFQRANRGGMKDVWVAGNSGFPLMDWILVPYTHRNLTWSQHAFNGKIDEVQKVARDAFMRLKARWSCLQRRTEIKLQDLPVVLGACCVLHNICEMRNEQLNPELKFDLFDDEMIAENGVRSVNAMHARDQIAHKLLHHNFAGTNVL